MSRAEQGRDTQGSRGEQKHRIPHTVLYIPLCPDACSITQEAESNQVESGPKLYIVYVIFLGLCFPFFRIVEALVLTHCFVSIH